MSVPACFEQGAERGRARVVRAFVERWSRASSRAASANRSAGSSSSRKGASSPGAPRAELGIAISTRHTSRWTGGRGARRRRGRPVAGGRPSRFEDTRTRARGRRCRAGPRVRHGAVAGQYPEGYDCRGGRADEGSPHEQEMDRVGRGGRWWPSRLAALLLIPRGGVAPGSASWPASKDISNAELTDLVARGARLVDVRTAVEFAGGHIEGAENVPIDDLPAAAAVVGQGEAGRRVLPGRARGPSTRRSTCARRDSPTCTTLRPASQRGTARSSRARRSARRGQGARHGSPDDVRLRLGHLTRLHRDEACGRQAQRSSTRARWTSGG